MNKLEYIPGDLVKANNNPNIIWRVQDMSKTKHINALYRLVAVEDSEVFVYLREHQIEPIPLTPEILEKNGWMEDKGDYINDSNHIMLVEQYEKWSAYKVVFNTMMWLRSVKSVSDLQHLLFGLGLNSEMEVQVCCML